MDLVTQKDEPGNDLIFHVPSRSGNSLISCWHRYSGEEHNTKVECALIEIERQSLEERKHFFQFPRELLVYDELQTLHANCLLWMDGPFDFTVHLAARTSFEIIDLRLSPVADCSLPDVRLLTFTCSSSTCELNVNFEIDQSCIQLMGERLELWLRRNVR